MTYQILALKWRPKKFSEIVGQAHIIKAMIRSFILNRIHHAYILSGTRGSGKTTIARLFAKGLNCEIQFASNNDVCGQCKNCLDIESGCFIDLIEIDAASRSKVEETREFLDNMQYAPSQSQFKIYLIDEAHMLSRHSFNALLKTLEEPPHHVKFILITTDHQKLPETILSRCLQFYLKPLSTSQITTQLQYICNQENININDIHLLELLANSAKGSMRDALNLLEQAIILGDSNHITSDVINNMLGILDVDDSISLIEDLMNGNINNIMHKIDHYSNIGIDWDHFFSEILTILQKIAINQFTSFSTIQQHNTNNKSKNINHRIHNLRTKISPETIQLYYQIFLLGRQELSYAPSYRIGTEMTILRALAFSPINIQSKKNSNKNDINKFNDNLKYCKNSLPQSTTHLNMLTIPKSKTLIKKPLISNKIHTNTNTIELQKIQHQHNLSVVDRNLPQNIIPNDNSSNHQLHLGDVTKIFNTHLVSNKIPSNTVSEILKARSKLINYHDNYNKTIKMKAKSDKNIEFQKKLANILKRFSDINMTAIPHDSKNIKKK
ncbi:DNA polymerase III subunit gamma/tau [Candidatus Blochmanniella vafra]|uniref:DNA polymerase III subunit gamma/tau n=1 Tax=Candidatus Blochmanniella vafra TaxID=251535 RepID=UPI0003127E10|nr:DNA polymerase III subunit gamma/tau [Candidatus Blochmannia vafer]